MHEKDAGPRVEGTQNSINTSLANDPALKAPIKLLGIFQKLSDDLCEFISSSDCKSQGSDRSSTANQFLDSVDLARRGVRHEILQIANEPEKVAEYYRLSESSFDRTWAKMLDVSKEIERCVLDSGSLSGESWAGLSRSLVDAVMELNRIEQRRQAQEKITSERRALEEEDGPITFTREEFSRLGEGIWDDDDTRHAVRGV